MSLRGTNIFLRALEPTDIDLLYNWENDTGIWRLSNTKAPFSKFVLEQYIKASAEDIYSAKQLRFVICLNDSKAIGCIDLFDFDPANKRAGIGILIADAGEKGKGYGSESLALLTSYAFEVLHLHQLYCNITPDNEVSIRLFLNHKFRIAGTKKDWIYTGKGWVDELFLQRINDQ